jgi:hypothetical protein
MTKCRAFSSSALSAAAFIAVFGLFLPGPVAAQSLALEQTVALPGVQGRLDHIDIDIEGNRLFVAALAADSAEVIDLKAGKRIRRLQHLHEPQGVAYFPASRRLFVANGSGGGVAAFEDGNAAALVSAKDLDDADNMRVDLSADRLYVGYAHALAVLDPGTLHVVARVDLANHPEGFELEHKGNRIFVNVPRAGHIAVVDRSSGKVSATWPLQGASGNFAMALDEPNHRLFVAARQPATMLVYDTNTGRQTTALAICGDADDLFFDQQRRQLYAVCGEGVIAVIRQLDPDHYAVTERRETAAGARTGLFVPARSTLYVAVPARGQGQAEIRAYKVR